VARVLLLGDPVARSLSPAMQNAAFAALGLPHRYELMRLPAEEVADFLRTAMRSDDVLGANVTIPHKEIVAPHLDGTLETARRIGAVNTIFKHGRRLIGDNTDVDGFAGALAEKRVDVDGKRFLLLGAGGAARACYYALHRRAGQITVRDRTPGRAASLVSSFTDMVDATPYPWPPREVEGYDVIVNATSLGMHGEHVLDGVKLPSSLAVVDVVATREESPLIARARAAGCVAVDGLLMLLHQGTRAFQLWTEREAPIDVMRATLPRAV